LNRGNTGNKDKLRPKSASFALAALFERLSPRRDPPAMALKLFIQSLPRENGDEGYKEFQKLFGRKIATEPGLAMRKVLSDF
jgi:hypothetical protein